MGLRIRHKTGFYPFSFSKEDEADGWTQMGGGPDPSAFCSREDSVSQLRGAVQFVTDPFKR